MPSSLQSGVSTATAANPLGGLGEWGSRAVPAGAAAAAPNRVVAQPRFGNFMPSNVDFSSSSAAAAQGQGTNTTSLDSAVSLSKVPSTTGNMTKSMSTTVAALSAGDAEQAHASAMASWAGGAASAGFTTLADKLRLMSPKDQLGLITGAQMAQLDDGRNQPLGITTSQPLANSFKSCSDATRDLKAAAAEAAASASASASNMSAESTVNAGNLASSLTTSKLDGQGAGVAKAVLGAATTGASNNSSACGVSALPGGGDAPSNATPAPAGGGNQTVDPSLLTPELLGMYAQLLIQQQEQERQRLQSEQQAQFQKLQQLQKLLQQQ